MSDDKRPLRSRATRWLKRRWVKVAGRVGLGFMAAAPVLGALFHLGGAFEAWAPTLARAAIVGAAGAFAVAEAYRRGRVGRGVVVEVVGEGRQAVLRITFGAEVRELPVTEIERGWVVPNTARPRLLLRENLRRGESKRAPAMERGLMVVLQTRAGDEVRVALDTLEEAQALLASAVVAEDERRVKIERRWHGQFVAGSFLGALLSVIAVPLTFLALAGVGGALAVLYAAGVVLTMGWLGVRALRPAPVEVGTDGVRVGGGADDFIPITQIRGVSSEGDVVRVETESGVETIRMGPVSTSGIALLVSRIEDALASIRPAARLAQLDLRTRSVATWSAAIAEWVGMKDTFRGAKIPRVRIEEALEDVSAPPAQRLGAAMALQMMKEDDDVKVRIESIASSTADAGLREALEALAEDRLEDEHLEAISES